MATIFQFYTASAFYAISGSSIYGQNQFYFTGSGLYIKENIHLYITGSEYPQNKIVLTPIYTDFNITGCTIQTSDVISASLNVTASFLDLPVSAPSVVLVNGIYPLGIYYDHITSVGITVMQISGSSGTIYIPSGSISNAKYSLSSSYTITASYVPNTDTTTNYIYDISGSLIYMEDTAGNSQIYKYDAFGNLLNITGSGKFRSKSFVYDILGNLTTKSLY